jgi:hypothetical protein
VLYNPGEDGDYLDVCILNIHLNNALNIRLGTRNIDTKKTHINPYLIWIDPDLDGLCPF